MSATSPAAYSPNQRRVLDALGLKPLRMRAQPMQSIAATFELLLQANGGLPASKDSLLMALLRWVPASAVQWRASDVRLALTGDGKDWPGGHVVDLRLQRGQASWKRQLWYHLRAFQQSPGHTSGHPSGHSHGP